MIGSGPITNGRRTMGEPEVEPPGISAGSAAVGSAAVGSRVSTSCRSAGLWITIMPIAPSSTLSMSFTEWSW